MGFPSLLHALADLWGTARIRSGEAGLVIDRTQEERKKHSAYLPWLPGVHVSVRCAWPPLPDATARSKNVSIDMFTVFSEYSEHVNRAFVSGRWL